jgi:hypothetical protein
MSDETFYIPANPPLRSDTRKPVGRRTVSDAAPTLDVVTLGGKVIQGNTANILPRPKLIEATAPPVTARRRFVPPEGTATFRPVGKG